MDTWSLLTIIHNILPLHSDIFQSSKCNINKVKPKPKQKAFSLILHTFPMCIKTSTLKVGMEKFEVCEENQEPYVASLNLIDGRL